MSFKVPSLADVSRTIENGFSSAFYGTSGALRVGVLKVLSRVVAGGCYLPILFCQYIFRNSFIDTCDVENLVRFGGWYNLPHKVASPARGYVWIFFSSTMTGSATIPANTIFVDPNTGDEFRLLKPVYGVANSVEWGEVVAESVGKQGNRTTDEQTPLAFRDGEIFGVKLVRTYMLSGGASFDVAINGTTEQWGEDVESYRTRLKFRRQHPPMGGADSDYKIWAERFSQVTDAFVFANFPKTNSVSVLCADYNSSISVTEESLEDVRQYITSSSRKPNTADVLVESVSPVVVKLQISMKSIGGNVRADSVSALKKGLKALNIGDTITTTLVKRILVDSGVVDDCEVTSVAVGSRNYTIDGYKLKLEFLNEKYIRGEVVDINNIDENLNLVVG